MKIKPIAYRVFVDVEETPDKTEGGVIIPDVARQKPEWGEVVSVGEGIEELSVGDRVLFRRDRGVHVDSLEGNVYMFRLDEIWAKEV